LRRLIPPLPTRASSVDRPEPTVRRSAFAPSPATTLFGQPRPPERDLSSLAAGRLFLLLVILALIAGFGTACRSLPPLPPADLSAPGWQVRQGQAVWRPTRGRPELVGELLLATNTNGDFFVRFAKTPFPLATARVAAGRWQIEFGADGYRRRGHGRPPDRFAWFQLPAALNGVRPGRPWQFLRLSTHSWRLENRRTGERLEGVFFP
jgi:hypothetical protein